MTVPRPHHSLQATLGTPPAAVAGGNPLLPLTSQQRLQPNAQRTQQYAFRDPRMEYVTNTLRRVAARQAAAYVSKQRAWELGTAATLEDSPPGCSTGPNSVSTAAEPAAGSVGGRLGLSTVERVAAESAVASGEEEAQQVTPSLGHLNDAVSGQEARLGKLKSADVLMHAPEKVPHSLMPFKNASCVLQGAALHQLAAVVCSVLIEMLFENLGGNLGLCLYVLPLNDRSVFKTCHTIHALMNANINADS